MAFYSVALAGLELDVILLPLLSARMTAMSGLVLVFVSLLEPSYCRVEVLFGALSSGSILGFYVN